MGGVPSTPQNTGGGDDVFRGGVSHYEFRRGEIVSLGARGSYREKACRMMLVRCLLIGMELFDFWNKLLDLPSSSRWPSDRVHQACELFELLQASDDDQASIYKKAVNAMYIASVFLKHLIENGKSDSLEELHLFLDESNPVPHGFVMGIDSLK
ncbi:hypothetical protein F2Q70_00016519 [Brassica cretica]|uniref:Uncharacterized protein n=1 Tax=Brassica cretica TaxID=69181 RepID=A0A8S9I0X8_BRACR|nr:hypothetical protein F2Q70_00016519 [Brassica cretica]